MAEWNLEFDATLEDSHGAISCRKVLPSGD